MIEQDNATDASAKKALRDWQTPFLRVLKGTGNVSYAAQKAHIQPSTAYRAYKRSRTFAAFWEEAISISTGILEEVARRRAIKTSDTLLIFLLKARKPEMYRETVRQEITGKEGGPVSLALIDEVLKRADANP